MKKLLALLLIAAMTFAFVSCNKVSTEEPADSTDSGKNNSEKVSSDAAEEKHLDFDVYYITTPDGKKLSISDGTQRLSLGNENELYTRWTISYEKGYTGEKIYYIYVGDDCSQGVNAPHSYAGGNINYVDSKSRVEKDAKSQIWKIIENDDGTYTIQLATNPDWCISYDKDGKVTANTAGEGVNQKWKIIKAAPSTQYNEYVSKKGNMLLRVPKNYATSKGIGFTDERAQKYIECMQEAYDLEVELTDYVPYEHIIISGWRLDIDYIGVSNNYCVINAAESFMKSEVTKIAGRDRFGFNDLSFGMLHELGHMFDSGRGWNFESESWTDLKLCYVLYKTGYAAAPAEYSTKQCFTYKTIGPDCYLPIGTKEGMLGDKNAKNPKYSFMGSSYVFLMMAYEDDFGWEPFIKTFHWFQDEGKTEKDYSRLERFTTFVDKLSEYSGQDVKAKIGDLWDCFVTEYSK